MSCEFTLWDYLQSVEIFLYGLVQGLRIDHDVWILCVFEWNDFQLKLLPLITNALKYLLVFGFSICMLNDVMNVFLVILNIVFSQIDDGKLILCFQMRSFNQVKNLHPMPTLQRIFP